MSDQVRSSCMARSCRSRLSVSDSLSVTSAIHFSAIAIHLNKKARNAQARRRAKLALLPARRSSLSCGLLDVAVGGADECPIDVGPEFFASDGAVGHALNRDAMLERHTALGPLAYCPGCDAQRFSQRTLASEDLAGCFDCVHVATLAALTAHVNSPAKYIFV